MELAEKFIEKVLLNCQRKELADVLLMIDIQLQQNNHEQAARYVKVLPDCVGFTPKMLMALSKDACLYGKRVLIVLSSDRLHDHYASSDAENASVAFTLALELFQRNERIKIAISEDEVNKEMGWFSASAWNLGVRCFKYRERRCSAKYFFYARKARELGYT
ncbi:hypothetical protein INT43_002682 [Umbelopsis isabellina]|uniref:Uncharacterized protein n=1 Tax=Mortierella isabellina TaxID=91625 RepID=A0A8H7Q6Y5_MORIS|nr:hypothetical protein INT43_002682 [Umbelopsis isabellina]